jgi:hypothetical protein
LLTLVRHCTPTKPIPTQAYYSHSVSARPAYWGVYVALSNYGFQRRRGSGILSVAPWWWEGAAVDFVRRSATTIIVGIVLAFVGLAYLCWPLFALAVYALRFFAGVAAGPVTYHGGSGPIGAIIIGVLASSITLIAGQIAFTTLHSPLIRATIALLFAIPAAVAGYHAALGLAHISVSADGWQQAVAVIGAIVVAATAWVRMAFSAPPDA